ncbi:hypothetical protein Taro_024013 [Colocasia esculenta]|uniref:Uncharacterized protein n=1 Tax=Colocasia esculenta TaxID=4460 RepID=A0A843VD64_COLES|nr:hypothetical protein [Colocasia esculenta]
MKTKASGFLKQVVSLVMSIVKAKSMAVKSKTSAVKTRLIIFGLLRNKKVLMNTISHKVHAILGHQDKQGRGSGAADDDDDNDVDNSKAIVLYNAVPNEETVPDREVAASAAHGMMIESFNGEEAVEEAEKEEEDDDGYPDLRHSLFDEEDEYLQGDDGTGSVVDLVKNIRGEEQGDFVLEDEIDHVADVFIRRFHRQMRMQKLESFKRFQEMMERSV